MESQDLNTGKQGKLQIRGRKYSGNGVTAQSLIEVSRLVCNKDF